MKLWTILPVKSLQHTKSRLSNVLSLTERASLTQTLLTRTLHLLQAVPQIVETAVITQDPVVAKMAASFGCRSWAEAPDSGLNGAVATGTLLAAQNGATHCLVLPSDLPFLAESELQDMVHLVASCTNPPTLFLCSDQQQQGTNAMIVPSGLNFRFQYGRYSFQRHQQEAIRLGLNCQIMQFPGIQFDLDSEQDYIFYMNHCALFPC